MGLLGDIGGAIGGSIAGPVGYAFGSDSYRDEARTAELRANRAVEAGKKFEKFEDFQASVMSEINSLKSSEAAKAKEIEDLKSILANRSAITPNYGSAPAVTTPPKNPSEDIQRLNNMFGTKLS